MSQMNTVTDRWAWIRATLDKDEGMRLKAYPDQYDNITIGRGHNLTANPVPGIPARLGTVITMDQALRLAEHDLQKAVSEVYSRVPFAVDLAPARFDVLVMMAFNLGIDGLLGFHNMLAAVQKGNFEEAARQMLASKWAMQLGDGEGGKDDRPERLAKIMRTGEYPAA
ncbi:glycoside hydrolase family protein [Humidesulfovibrio idahonensis]